MTALCYSYTSKSFYQVWIQFETMDDPSKREIPERAASGEPVTRDEASRLAREEGDVTGWGPIPGGAAGARILRP